MGNSSNHTTGTECGYIGGEEGNQDVVTKQCVQPLAGRYVTILRDPRGRDQGLLNLCEVMVMGYLYPSGMLRLWTYIVMKLWLSKMSILVHISISPIASVDDV